MPIRLALALLSCAAAAGPTKQVPGRSAVEAVPALHPAAVPVSAPKTLSPSAIGLPAPAVLLDVPRGGLAAGAAGAPASAAPEGFQLSLQTLDVLARPEDAGAWDGMSRREDARFAQPGSPAYELRASRLEAYDQAHSPLGYYPPRTPFGDYLIHFTEKSKSVQRFWRDTALRSSLLGWAMVPGPFGAPARQGLKALDFIAKVEANPPEWATPNEVVLDEPTFLLRDFNLGGQADPAKTPILIVPPNSGHYSTIADFADDKSIVQTALKSGHPTYAIDWKSAASDNPQLYDDMVHDVMRGVERLGGKVILVGLCQGGVAATMLAADHPEMVAALGLAGSPIDATRGDNDVTRIAKEPMELFRWFVHGLGKPNVYDGATQLEGFLNLGQGKREKLLKSLMDNASNEAWVKDALPFWRWFFHTRDLSGAWFLQAIERLFKANDLFENRYELLKGAQAKRLDLGKLDMPVFLMEGTKDDITPPATLEKSDLTGVVPDPEAAWRFLNRAGFISDHGEDGINRAEDKKAVVEPRVFSTPFGGFALKNDRYVKATDAKALRALYDLVRSRKGQTLALSEKIATPKRDQFLTTFNGGHIGLYNSGAVQDVWAEAFDRLAKAISRRH